jgi:RNA polymerase sigma-70 factor (ECF subfamily)
MPLTVPPELLALAVESPESVSDRELMTLLCELADENSLNALFSEFYRRFHPRVLAWCTRFTHDRARAMDLSQEVFLKAWRRRDSFRGESKPSTWLYSITRNHFLNNAERLVFDPLEAGVQIPARLPDVSMRGPEEQIELFQRYEQLQNVMRAALDPLEARILTLHYGHDVPLRQLARGLVLKNPSGAKAFIVNGRRKLKAALARRGPVRKRALVPAVAVAG